ncbi:hypothetical protein MPSYJ_31740 [Mycolicibacterium psychrotolerans]|uniref:Uncharacterized protein n=1 Tax=Mycolicibacterium psychrotolerans TaxID=216929 RepID=A0A7I7MDW9_9MYCO|nr:hypothetical protein MPSYJ_31740 [Mycolicibacterium psychrotolerans]
MKIFGIAATILALGVFSAPTAAADQYIAFGVNETACKAAARQANAMAAPGASRSFCYETGPGHYTLFYGD